MLFITPKYIKLTDSLRYSMLKIKYIELYVLVTCIVMKPNYADNVSTFWLAFFIMNCEFTTMILELIAVDKTQTFQVSQWTFLLEAVYFAVESNHKCAIAKLARPLYMYSKQFSLHH